MAAKKRSVLCRILSFVLLVIILLGMLIFVFLLLTPSQLGLSNSQIGNSTVSELGFDSVSFFDISRLFYSVSQTPSQSKIAPNAYTENDKTSADGKFSQTNIGVLKNIVYSGLFLADALDAADSPLVLTEREIACAVDSALAEAYASPLTSLTSSLLTAVEVLQNLSISVLQTDFYQQDGATCLRVIIKIDISAYNGDVKQYVNVADTIFCTIDYQITITSDSSATRGMIAEEQIKSICLNSLDAELSQRALDALLMLVAAEGEAPLTSKQIAGYVFATIRVILGHIGEIGLQSGNGYTYGVEAIDFEAETVSFVPTL